MGLDHLLLHRLAGDPLHPVEHLGLEVPGGQDARGVQGAGVAGGAVLQQPLHAGVGRQYLVQPVAVLYHLQHVGDGDPAAAPHGHGLQLLGAHHGAQAAPARRPDAHQDHRVGGAGLAGLADGRYLDRLVAQLVADLLLGLEVVLPHRCEASRISTLSSWIHR